MNDGNDSGVRLYTIGHSQRSLDELIALLAEAGVRCVVDVRRYPASKRHPHFAADSLRAACEAAGLTYHWAGRQLGGYRPTSPGAPHSALSPGLRGYAEYMQGERFAANVRQLIDLARRAPTAILCAEKHPQQCHRGLIADYLCCAGVQVEHLIEPGRRERHALRPTARLAQGGLVYDRLSQESLPLEP